LSGLDEIERLDPQIDAVAGSGRAAAVSTTAARGAEQKYNRGEAIPIHESTSVHEDT